MSFITSKIPWRRRSVTDQNKTLSEDIGHLLSDISKHPVHTSGGFGDIYTGKHRKVGKVALKRPRISADVDDETIRRFLREADTWRGLVHPHVLPFVGIGRVNKQIYLVSPYIDNGTLVDYIKTHPDVDRARLLREASSAVAFLHASGFVHGDIKANNVLVSNDVHALLCDFGLAKTAQSVTSEGMKGAGNARWQAPELWDDCPKSFESDVYSLGMMIIEVLTGSLPFADIRDNTAVMKAVLIDHKRPSRPIFSTDSVELYDYLWDIAEFCCATAAHERPNMEVCLPLLEQTLQLQRAGAGTAGLIPAAELRLKIEAYVAVLQRIERAGHQEGATPPRHSTTDVPFSGSQFCPWGAIIQDRLTNGFPSTPSSLPTIVAIFPAVTSAVRSRLQRARIADGFSSPLSASSSFLAGQFIIDANSAVVSGVPLAIDTLERIYSSITTLAYDNRRGEILTDEGRSIFHLKGDSLDGARLKEAIDRMNMLLSRIHDDIHWWNGHSPGQGWLGRNEVVLGIQAHGESYANTYKVLRMQLMPSKEQRMKTEEEQRMQTEEEQRMEGMHERSLDEILRDLQLAATLQNNQATAKLFDQVGALQQVLKESASGTQEHRKAERELCHIRKSKHALCLPSFLERECAKVGSVPVVSGSTYDVWEGLWLGEIPVALKFNRSFRLELKNEVNKKRFDRQVDLWRLLDHEFVLKLHGWYMADDGDVYIVSPWMKNGNIRAYLEKEKPGPDIRLRLVTEVATGLKYLHGAGILHGGLCPSNVLVQKYGHAVVSDFSLSKIMAEDAVVTQNNTHTTAFRYQAPETYENKPMSTAGDVYSWAMTALDIVSGLLPFPRCTSPNALMTAIFAMKATPQMADHTCDTFEQFPELWKLLAQCWDPIMGKRPTLDVILRRLDTLRHR